METAVIIIVAAAAALLVIFLSNLALRHSYTKRFRLWQDQEIQKWQTELAASRRNAVVQSRATLGGRFTEQMVPYLPEFRYDPTEARFIGTPIDLVVFPGLAQGDPQEVVIMEIKTGRNPQLTPAQKKIRELIEDGMVRWEEIYRPLVDEDPFPEDITGTD